MSKIQEFLNKLFLLIEVLKSIIIISWEYASLFTQNPNCKLARFCQLPNSQIIWDKKISMNFSILQTRRTKKNISRVQTLLL